MTLRRILFVSHVDSYFSGFQDLVLRLKQSSEFEPFLLFPSDYPNLAKHVQVCESEKIEHLVTATVGGDRRHGVHRLLGRAASYGLRLLLALPGLGYAAYLAQYSVRRGKIAAVLRDLTPSLIVLGGDIVGHDMALYIMVGHRLGVPSTLLPGWMASAREPAETYYNSPLHGLGRPLNRLLGKYFPQWVYEHKGRKLVREPAQQAFALETLSLAPPRPWILHSGFADRIAVESIAAFEYGKAEGLPESVMVVTGSSTHDKMHRQITDPGRLSRLADDYDLDPSRPIVLTALPPNQLYGLGRPECDFKNYRDLVTRWISAICAAAGSRNVLVSLHPSAGTEYDALIGELGGKVVRESVAEIIPLSDFYVASISATIQWAIACGKPVINYDVYRYRYTDYVGLKGVLTIEEQHEFVELLAKMAGDPTYRESIASLQRKDAPRYGNLDGKAGDRIVALIESLIAARSAVAQPPKGGAQA